MKIKIYDNDNYYIAAKVYDCLGNETEFEIELYKGDYCIYHIYIIGLDLIDAIQTSDESFVFDEFDDIRRLHLTTASFSQFQTEIAKITLKYDILLAGLDKLVEELKDEREGKN